MGCKTVFVVRTHLPCLIAYPLVDRPAAAFTSSLHTSWRGPAGPDSAHMARLQVWYAQVRWLSAVSACMRQGVLGATSMHWYRNSFRSRVGSSIQFAWYSSWGLCGMHSQNVIRER
jgi:hypothetical protein